MNQSAFILNGERGIRTLVEVTPKQHFQCCAFNHSAISPDSPEQSKKMPHWRNIVADIPA